MIITNMQTEAPKPKALERGAGNGLAQGRHVRALGPAGYPIRPLSPKRGTGPIPLTRRPSVGSRYQAKESLWGRPGGRRQVPAPLNLHMGDAKIGNCSKLAALQ
jgi:hypothetical protein